MSVRSIVLQAGFSLGLTLLLIALALKSGGMAAVGAYAAAGRLHWPNVGLVTSASLAIQLHVLAVLSALIVGAILMSGVKGNRLHRTLGWGWVVAMAVAAVASLFIRVINHGGLSWLHLFSGWTLIALPIAVVAARRRQVRLHSRTMTGLFVGGLVVAGITAFLPGRLMWQVFFG